MNTKTLHIFAWIFTLISLGFAINCLALIVRDVSAGCVLLTMIPGVLSLGTGIY